MFDTPYFGFNPFLNLKPGFTNNYGFNYTGGYFGNRLPGPSIYSPVDLTNTQRLHFNQRTAQTYNPNIGSLSNNSSDGARSLSNKVSAIAGTAIDIAGDIGSIKAAGAIPTAAPEDAVDYTGRPVYNLGQYAIDTWAIKPRGASVGEIVSGAANDAMAAAAFTANPVVAGAAALFGATRKIVTGLIRKRKMRKIKERRNRILAQKQNAYNTGVDAFNNNRLALEQYYDQLNMYNRLQNIYGEPER